MGQPPYDASIEELKAFIAYQRRPLSSGELRERVLELWGEAPLKQLAYWLLVVSVRDRRPAARKQALALLQEVVREHAFDGFAEAVEGWQPGRLEPARGKDSLYELLRKASPADIRHLLRECFRRWDDRLSARPSWDDLSEFLDLFALAEALTPRFHRVVTRWALYARLQQEYAARVNRRVHPAHAVEQGAGHCRPIRSRRRCPLALAEKLVRKEARAEARAAVLGRVFPPRPDEYRAFLERRLGIQRWRAIKLAASPPPLELRPQVQPLAS